MKTFILIVGKETNSITKGSCQYCNKYKNICGNAYCESGNPITYKSYIQHECNLAVKNELNIVVLYNSNYVNKQLHPEIIRNNGRHISMKEDGIYNYSKVRNAILMTENKTIIY